MTDATDALARAKVMSRMRGNCDNCGEPMMAHCQRHTIPCCPRYPQHEQAAEAADRSKSAESTDTATPPSAAADLDVEGVIAEMIGVESLLEQAGERLSRATTTLGSLAAAKEAT